jgi:antirestriction protein ArdC
MNNVYKIVTDRIIDELEKGVIPWKKPWKGSWPKNLISKKEYQGINCLLLSLNDYKSSYYLTYNQAKSLGGNVKKGEKGHLIIFWKMYDTKEVDEDDKLIVKPVLRYYKVFNTEQCEGIETPKEKKNNSIKDCEKVVKNYKNKPEIGNNVSRAFYSPLNDKVSVPHINSFKASSDYYSVLFHELVHSTGHKKRLNRFNGEHKDTFGSKSYSKEELIAELGSAFLCAKTGIDNSQVKRSASYIDNWLKALKGDSHLIISASSKGKRAVEYMEGKLVLDNYKKI